MGRTLDQLANENAAGGRALGDLVIPLLLGPVVVAGVGAGLFWLRGGAMTLGHLIAVVAGVASLGGALWWRRQSRRRAA